jgi:hypothetical protein
MIKLAPPKDKLGYIWLYCNYAIALAKEKNEEVALCTSAISKNPKESFVDKTDLIKEVLELLDHDVTITLHNDLNGKNIRLENSDTPYYNTKVTWSLDKVNNYRVAHQLDGSDISKWYRGNIDGVKYFNTNVKDRISLSKKYSLSEIVNILSTSFLFIGADSGISHVAHSVGIPMYILGNRLSKSVTQKWHNGNKYETVGSLQEFALSIYPYYRNNTAKYVGAKYGNNRQHSV